MTLEGKRVSRKTGLRIRKYFGGSGSWITNAQCCGARICIDFGQLDLDPDPGGQK